MIHFEANLRSIVERRPGILYWNLDPDAPGVFVAHDIDRTWVFMHPYDADTQSAVAYTVPVCAEIVRRALGTDGIEFTIRDVSPWTMTAQIATHYTAGHVFLVGDSAHRFPPTGGLGMNTGIQDAHNLVWKLRAVADGWALPAILETYESERRPVAQRNAEQSFGNALKMLSVFDALGLAGDPTVARQCLGALLADATGRARIRNAIDEQQEHFDLFGLQLGFVYEAGAIVGDDTEPPVGGDSVRDYVPSGRPGARVPHAWIEPSGARRSTLDLVPYDRFTMLCGPEGFAWLDATAQISGPPIRCLLAGCDFTDRDGRWAAMTEVGRDGALLVRPDQHIAWRARAQPADPGAALRGALGAILGQGSV
jgi:hypothetical protein